MLTDFNSIQIAIPQTQSSTANDTNDNADGDASESANAEGDDHAQQDEDPIYVKLYEKTHRYLYLTSP